MMLDKPDGPLGRIGWRHEFTQGIEDLLELGLGVAAKNIVIHGQRFGLVFEVSQALGQVAIGGGQFREALEGGVGVKS